MPSTTAILDVSTFDLAAIAEAAPKILDAWPAVTRLSPKQQAFLAEYCKDFNGNRAAVAVGYSTNNGWFGLQRSKGVFSALTAIQGVIAARAMVNLAGHLKQLANLRDKAIELDQIGAAVRAEELRGKVGGLYVDRVSVTAEQDMTDQELATEMAKLAGISYEEALARLISTDRRKN